MRSLVSPPALKRQRPRVGFTLIRSGGGMGGGSPFGGQFGNANGQ
jgi:hypothetical protein